MSSLSGDATQLRAEVNKYVEYWKREQELRQKEAAADDLPRVKLTTTKGDIVLELFENEAPETVGNFINLVEKGFYKDLTFHRVIAGFMAQGGCPEGDGTGGPGYSIYDECGKPDARMHFRGSISMAKTNAPNSGGSQFFICFRPTPNLNGIHTVFGRRLRRSGRRRSDSATRAERERRGTADRDSERRSAAQTQSRVPASQGRVGPLRSANLPPKGTCSEASLRDASFVALDGPAASHPVPITRPTLSCRDAFSGRPPRDALPETGQPAHPGPFPIDASRSPTFSLIFNSLIL